MLQKLNGVAERCFAVLVASAVILLSGGLCLATEPTYPTTVAAALTDTGIDMGGLVGECIAAAGAVLGVCVVGYFAFLIIRKAMRWGARAAG